MDGARFDRVKNWNDEILTNEDLNAEIDNILEHLNPLGLGSYSDNIARMRFETDPGDVGTESLATSLAGEIERLRYEIRAIKGGDALYWYSQATSSLSDLRQLVGGSTLSTRISSGATTGNSSALRVIIPDGTNDGFHIEGSPTNLIYLIRDNQYTIDDDSTIIDGLVKAPSTNNTCLVDDVNATSGPETRFLGMYNSVINVDAMGSNITSLVGKVAGFKLGATEYFTAFVESTTCLRLAVRGGWIDSATNEHPALAFSDNATITLMKLTWVFLTSDKTILVTYNEPTYSALAPDSPNTGDFWYDMTLGVWKRFDGSVFTQSNVAFIGQSMQDATNCVAAKSVQRFSNQDATNTIDLEWANNAEVRVKNVGAQISVFGKLNRFDGARPTWNMASHLDPAITEAANTVYFLYMKETGAPFITTQPPVDRRGDLRGWYHPYETWRYVGKISNNGSSNFDKNTLVVAFRTKEVKFFSNEFEDVGSTKMQWTSVVAPGWAVCESASLSRFLYNELYESGFIAMGTATGTANGYVFNLPYTQGMHMRGWNHGAGQDPDTAGRTAIATGGNTGDNIGSYQADAFQRHGHRISYRMNQGVNPGLADDFDAAPNTSRDDRVGEPIDIGSGLRVSSETRPKNIYVQYVIKVLS